MLNPEAPSLPKLRLLAQSLRDDDAEDAAEAARREAHFTSWTSGARTECGGEVDRAAVLIASIPGAFTSLSDVLVLFGSVRDLIRRSPNIPEATEALPELEAVMDGCIGGLEEAERERRDADAERDRRVYVG